ncbi:UbiA prenyltransferase [Colletotrichum musicola]|uniref:UbiA prenyltransferase n=1 Tax=Colletotrichum musicola TaxID=2175873 RepID=A0A8H6JJ02_9PEZI|nr:UbiA prenyltransferase [Colletotrichum musicola]
MPKGTFPSDWDFDIPIGRILRIARSASSTTRKNASRSAPFFVPLDLPPENSDLAYNFKTFAADLFCDDVDPVYHGEQRVSTYSYKEDSSAKSTVPERPADIENNAGNRFIPKALSNVGAFSSAAVMWLYSGYDNRCELPGGDMATHRTPLSNDALDLQNRILELVENPSPEAFFLSMLAYGAGIATIYHLSQRHDRYQDAALAVGITTAFGAGSILGEDARSIFLRILPFSVLAILAISALAHHNARWVKAQPVADTYQEKPMILASLVETT